MAQRTQGERPRIEPLICPWEAVMSFGRIGFDLVTISRFETLYRDDMLALHTIFVESELADAGPGIDRWSRLAARFAAKEATFKALKHFPAGARLLDVTIHRAVNGAPELRLSGATQFYAQSINLTDWSVSLSHTDDIAGAVVCAAAAPSAA